MKKIILAVGVAAVGVGTAGAESLSTPLLNTGPNRNATVLNVGFRRLGTLKTRTAAEIGPANWTIDGAPMDRDFVEFDKYRDYLPALGVSKIRVLSGWAMART